MDLLSRRRGGAGVGGIFTFTLNCFKAGVVDGKYGCLFLEGFVIHTHIRSYKMYAFICNEVYPSWWETQSNWIKISLKAFGKISFFITPMLPKKIMQLFFS